MKFIAYEDFRNINSHGNTMEVKKTNYGNLKLILAELSPSRYVFEEEGTAKMLSWQIMLADNSVRDVLFSEMGASVDSSNVGSRYCFNLKTPPISGIEYKQPEDLKFKISNFDKHSISFISENRENLPFSVQVHYRLYDLHFRAEITMSNNGTVPLFWKPEIHFFINLPWMQGIAFEKHIIKSFAKKRLKLSHDFLPISSVKSAEKLPFELLHDGVLGLCQLQDNKIWIGTHNEEEGLSFIFGDKTKQSVFVVKKTKFDNNLEVVFLSGIFDENIKSASKNDTCFYKSIASGKTDRFFAEILAY